MFLPVLYVQIFGSGDVRLNSWIVDMLIGSAQKVKCNTRLVCLRDSQSDLIILEEKHDVRSFIAVLFQRHKFVLHVILFCLLFMSRF